MGIIKTKTTKMAGICCSEKLSAGSRFGFEADTGQTPGGLHGLGLR